MSKEKDKIKGKGKSKGSMPSKVSKDTGPRRGWLGDLTGGILPDGGLYIGRSETVLGGQQGWGNPWTVKGSLHSKTVRD